MGEDNMCHRRGDWSRTSSRASEPDEEERESERERVGARVKRRLAALVSDGDEADRTPERPAVEPDATGGEVTDESEGTEDEREEEPIPADD